jgi:hypothetical protein
VGADYNELYVEAMSEEKKKFGDTKVGSWLKSNAPDILKTVSDLTPDGGVLDAVAGLIRGKEDMPAELKMEFERMYINERLALEEGVTRRWEADTQTRYWLPNNIRPLSVAVMLGAVVLFAGLDSIEGMGWETPEHWLSLLTTLGMTIFGAYFGGRSWEKVKKSN